MNLNGFNRLVQKNRVTGFEKFAYGCGEISTNIVFTIATSLLVMFYTDVVHVSAATIGVIIAISQVFNGASDIAAGFIVDRTRSKYGRARVWMLRMSIPYAVTAVLLMTVPQIGAMAQAIYIFITYNLMLATVYKGNIIKNLIMDCQSYTKYRPNETTGGIFVSWRRKEELPTGA